MIFDYDSLRNAEYDLENVFRPLGISEFLGYNAVIYEDLVKEFYANMEEIKQPARRTIALRTKVCGRGLVLSENVFCNLFNIPEGGVIPTGLSPIEDL